MTFSHWGWAALEKDIKTNGKIVNQIVSAGCGAKPVVVARWNPKEKKCESGIVIYNTEIPYSVNPADHCAAEPELKFVQFCEKCYLIDKSTNGRDLKMQVESSRSPNFDPNRLLPAPSNGSVSIDSSERSSRKDRMPDDPESAADDTTAIGR